MRVLISAYACEPGRGSEHEVGWNWALHTARLHDTWVLTRSKSRPAIEAALQDLPDLQVRFIYLDLPKWLRLWKKLPLGVQLYYYLWQLLAYLPAKRLHQSIHFDVVHHATFCTYWLPSLLALLPTRFIWGPVGGGESAPDSFIRSFSVRGRTYEAVRRIAQKIAECDPLLHITASRAAVAFATTKETAVRLARLGCKNIQVLSQVGITDEELNCFASHENVEHEKFRIFSAGRLSHLKGLHLALRAVAKLGESIPEIEYWIFGSGPEQTRLERLAKELKISEQVVFWPHASRSKLLRRIPDCDVLLHPGLHESGGLICMEAMAAGCAVVCLDLGGLAIQVTGQTGIKVPPVSPEQTVRDLASALRSLAEDPAKRRALGQCARNRAVQCFRWNKKVEAFWERCKPNGTVNSESHTELTFG